jgi:predicted aspartyl protease
LKCTIENETVYALVDTGATISVINKELADQLLKSNQEIPVLPINNVQISNAVGKKICKVSKQLFCQCQIRDKQVFINFVQVENLNERAIIGAEVLNQYNTHINFTDKTIEWSIQGEQKIIPFSEHIQERNEKKNHVTHVDIMENITTNVPISHMENETFCELIKEYQRIFSDSPGLIHEHECQIKITSGEPIYQRPYPMPISRLSQMDKEIQRMLGLGIIEKSDSPWSSPIVGIEKKNGDIRLCLDARPINKRFIPDRECPMGVKDILLKFQVAKYLSTIDLTAGYWQCRLKEESRPITAFLYRGRNYQI